MRGKNPFIEPDVGAYVTLRQGEHFTNPKEWALELLAGDDQADVLTTFAGEEPLLTGASKSTR